MRGIAPSSLWCVSVLIAVLAVDFVPFRARFFMIGYAFLSFCFRFLLLGFAFLSFCVCLFLLTGLRYCRRGIKSLDQKYLLHRDIAMVSNETCKHANAGVIGMKVCETHVCMSTAKSKAIDKS